MATHRIELDYYCEAYFNQRDCNELRDILRKLKEKNLLHRVLSVGDVSDKIGVLFNEKKSSVASMYFGLICNENIPILLRVFDKSKIQVTQTKNNHDKEQYASFYIGNHHYQNTLHQTQFEKKLNLDIECFYQNRPHIEDQNDQLVIEQSIRTQLILNVVPVSLFYIFTHCLLIQNEKNILARLKHMDSKNMKKTLLQIIIPTIVCVTLLRIFLPNLFFIYAYWLFGTIEAHPLMTNLLSTLFGILIAWIVFKLHNIDLFVKRNRVLFDFLTKPCSASSFLIPGTYIVLFMTSIVQGINKLDVVLSSYITSLHSFLDNIVENGLEKRLSTDAFSDFINQNISETTIVAKMRSISGS